MTDEERRAYDEERDAAAGAKIAASAKAKVGRMLSEAERKALGRDPLAEGANTFNPRRWKR